MTDQDAPALAPLDPLAGFRLDGKVAIVTGASSGLGHRFARVLHAAGATVVLTARRKDRLDELAAALPGSVVIAADVGVAADRERIISEAIQRCGTIDILVNNAGVGEKNPIETESLDEFEWALAINTTAVWHLCKLAGEVMTAKRSGNIINVASMLGLVASAPVKQAKYAASKGAVVNLTREIGCQWGRKGVVVNALCPGWFQSEMTAGMESDPGAISYVKTHCPMARMGDEHELDGALLLLASTHASYMTGQTLVIDGGWIAR